MLGHPGVLKIERIVERGREREREREGERERGREREVSIVEDGHYL